MASSRGVYKRVQLSVEPGKPIQLTEEEVSDAPSPVSAVSCAISHALKAYRKAATELITGKYSHLKAYTAPQFREPESGAFRVLTAAAGVPAGTEKRSVPRLIDYLRCTHNHRRPVCSHPAPGMDHSPGRRSA